MAMGGRETLGACQNPAFRGLGRSSRDPPSKRGGSSSGESSKRRDDGTRSGGGGGGGDRFRCVSCFRRPKTLGSPVEWVTRDPNDPEFSYEMTRELLQKNEFFSTECSTNLEAAYYMCDHGQ